MLWILASLLACHGDKNNDDSGGGGDDGGDDSTSPIGTDDDSDGYETPEDCDDGDADVNPGAPEVCDNIDNDCDTLIDAGDDDFEGGVTIFTDSDGDGYGDDETERPACASGVGTTEVGGDCDDANGGINPDALELCDDKVDSNCDDDPDYNCVGTVDNAYAIWSGEGASDDVGMDVAARGDLDGDGNLDVIVGGRENDDNGTDAGAAYILFGPLQSVESSLASADAEIFGSAGAKVGRLIEFVGNIGGGEGEDIALSAPTYDRVGAVDSGKIYLIDGGDIVGGAQPAEELPWAEFTGGAQFDYAGTDLQSGGDVDGDGEVDLWIGIAGDDDAGSDAGAIVLAAGPISGTTSLDSQAAKILAEGAGHLIGGVIAPGDYDGDGLRDLAIGDSVESETGAVYIVQGPVSGALGLAGADVKVVGNASGDVFGTSIANAGDANGDGLDDLLVGAPLSSTNASGEAVVLETPLKSGAASGMTVATFVDVDGGAEVGHSVAGNHDVDGDGELDALVGASNWGNGRGAAYLVGGPFAGTIELSTASLRWWIAPPTTNLLVGENVAFGGPALEGGGESILLPSPHADEGAIDAGTLYIEAY